MTELAQMRPAPNATSMIRRHKSTPWKRYVVLVSCSASPVRGISQARFVSA
jgi:hypothetical protein